MPVDDYTLAAFLAGELPEGKRRTVAAHLVTDQNARELLHMACEALSEAYETADGAEYMRRNLDLPPVRLNPGDRPARLRRRAMRGLT